MRIWSWLLCVLLVLGAPAAALAQPDDPDAGEAADEADGDASEPGAAEGEDAEDEDAEGEDAEGEGAEGEDAEGEDAEGEGAEGEGSPRLRRPTLEMPDVSGAGGAGAGEGEGAEGEGVEGEAAPTTEAGGEGEGPSPGTSSALLEQAGEQAGEGPAEGPPSSDPTKAEWKAPETVLTLHGYFRLRTELFDNFFLGRRNLTSMSRDPPFDSFKPIHRRETPIGGCGGDPSTEEGRSTECGGGDRLRFANMRMRLEPTLSISDDVRLHMQIDVFDNVVLGSTPESEVYIPPGAAGNDSGGFARAERTPGAPVDSFAATSSPPQSFRNSLEDSIKVRRAWAEVTNRGLGQLRFGRMGSHWGLGLLANGGDGIDADRQSDVDRLMGITKLAGFYLAAAWDWQSEGYVLRDVQDLDSFATDATSKDDIRQLVFAVARRTDEQKQKNRLQRGDWVLNGGIYFVWRKQDYSAANLSDPFGTPDGSRLVRRNARAFIPDLWVQFMWGDLRLEAEAVAIVGEIRNLLNDSFELGNYDILQFGAALEAEYRLLDDKLGIYFDTGVASGDEDVDGLSFKQGLLAQQTDDKTLSTFRFHPNYRIDLILWRNILGRVAGAYYFKPGVSYDLIRNPFGQRLGARADVVYSRAVREVQTYGSDPNLGVELDLSVYYQSEDGPAMTDGFYAQFQYGVLFPLAGMGYPSYRGIDVFPEGNPDPSNAQIIRLLFGVKY